jgi:ABC-type nickel/cobalt efflux system permease component RcnA
MKKILMVLLFFSYTLVYGCALCSTFIPIVNVNVKKSVSDNNTTFHITWNFDKAFTQHTLEQYSKQYDTKLKLQEAQKILIQYMSENLYLTHISGENKKKYKIKQIYNPHLKLNGTLLRFTYDVMIDSTEKLKIEFIDYQNYFLFNFNNQNIIETSNRNITNNLLDKLSNYLSYIKINLKSTLDDINTTGNPLSFFWLLLFSFIYGVIHAAGPGHGKSIVGAYFLKDNYSISKAFATSSAIGIVHTFSALLLTVVVYFIMDNVLSKFLLDIESATIKVSAVIIISIAIYLLYKKIQHKINKKIDNSPKWSTQPQHTHSNSTCGCGACNTQSTDIGVVLAAGMVPCPGTVTIFIFTLSIGAYFVGFLSALFMSIGMSLVIFVTAYLSIKVRYHSQKNEKLIKFFEYGSLVFILLMGIFLLLAS